MRITYLYILLSICALSSCSNTEENEIEPSGIKTGYTVPQGNNDFDNDIVKFYDDYGTYLLYRFTDKDAYWTPSKWTNGEPSTDDSQGKLGFIYFEPDENYIKPQLDLLNRTWFNHYSPEFLDKFLPVKILLCSQVQYCNFDFSSYPFKIKGADVPAYYNFDNICVSYAKEDVLNLTTEQETVFEKGINRVFVDCMYGQGKLNTTEVFNASANYSIASAQKTNTALWKIGILQPYYSASPNNDWKQFVTMMICYSEAYLNKDVTTVNEYDTKETSWEGIFSPIKDKNGLLKKRYDMVRQFYIDNYNIDLQLVGNEIYQ
ncbi:putative zinc-binding metallopeptidase [Mariniflexile sp. HMF6888]|uniref:putative zinc-binding metallopeptidase n=1 Tax=Mariniflexile sp. HMF6888 TaxID=3373086 RepID=UPI0037970A98